MQSTILERLLRTSLCRREVVCIATLCLESEHLHMYVKSLQQLFMHLNLLYASANASTNGHHSFKKIVFAGIERNIRNVIDSNLVYTQQLLHKLLFLFLSAKQYIYINSAIIHEYNKLQQDKLATNRTDLVCTAEEVCASAEVLLLASSVKSTHRIPNMAYKHELDIHKIKDLYQNLRL